MPTAAYHIPHTTCYLPLLGTFCLLLAACTFASEATIGWRGDGSGKYPSANPPVTWGRVSKVVKGLRFQARKPKEGETGTPMPDGVAHEWLVLGPVPTPEGAKIEKDTLPNEVQFAPDENEKSGSLAWRKVATDTAWLDFAKLFGMHPDMVAYACTNVYSETGGAVRLILTSVGKTRVSFNGKEGKPAWGVRAPLRLDKGWNRLLFKVAPGENDWFLVPLLQACPPVEYEESNIAYIAALPDVKDAFYGAGMGVASPLLLGDRMYLLSEPHDLICLNKATGKVLWLRRHSYFEAAPEEDHKHPAWAAASGIVARINAISDSYVAGTAKPAELLQKAALEKDLEKELRNIDAEKYTRGEVPDIGFSGCTPTTDGRFIYVWSASGVTVCYDLDGNRKWMRIDKLPPVEHGFSSSPLLVDGKVVVFMRDLMAFEAATGKQAWRIPVADPKGFNPGGFFHSSLAAAAVGGVKLIVLGNGLIVRASDGKVVLGNRQWRTKAVATPVVEKDMLLQLDGGSMELSIQKLPAAFSDPLKLETTVLKVETPFPKFFLPWHLSSPLVHEGLAYLMNNSGVFAVVDLQAGSIVYQKLLDLDYFWDTGAARGIGNSPALAGGRIYIFGKDGAALVLEPGRVYKQLAKNEIENVVMLGHWAERQERFLSNPIFEGKRIYIRGEGNLYALE